MRGTTMTTALVLAALLAVFQPASAFISTVPCVRPRTAPACMASSSSSSSDGDKTRVRLPIGRISSLDRSKIATDEDSQFYAAPRSVPDCLFLYLSSSFTVCFLVLQRLALAK